MFADISGFTTLTEKLS